MKTKFFFLIFLFSLIFVSCKDERTYIGYFTVTSKESLALNKDYGFVNMANPLGDTISVFVDKPEQYLNLVKGQEYRVGRDGNQKLFIYEDIEEYEEGLVGYTMLLKKSKGDSGVFRGDVVTNGQDTLYSVGISETTYYNVSPGDSVFVCRNLQNRTNPKYYIE